MIIVDTGPLVAAANHDDRDHGRCVELMAGAARSRRLLLVPAPVIAEVCYLLERESGRAGEREPGGGGFPAVFPRARVHARGAYSCRPRADGRIGGAVCRPTARRCGRRRDRYCRADECYGHCDPRQATLFHRPATPHHGFYLASCVTRIDCASPGDGGFSVLAPEARVGEGSARFPCRM